jgi:glycosyltransferase involved in cell wall biosynthesis
MVKILHIPNYYPPHIGGIEEVCYNIVSEISGYEHRIICFNDKKTTRKELYEGIEIIRCGVVKKLFSQSLSFSFFKELRTMLKEFAPNIVHFHMPNPLSSVYLLLLLPRKTQLIVHWHSDVIEQDLLYRFYCPIEKCLLKRADRILVTSPAYVSGSKPLLLWQNKLTVVANTVNTGKLQKREGDEKEIRKIKELYGNKKIVFTFGRHVAYKGLKYLIDAAPFISEETVIIIAGEGPLSDELKNRAAAYPAVYFIGRLSDDELRCYLYASDVFAFPSITRNEAFGVALAEAMYCGLPAVTFTIPASGVNWLCPDRETGLESENGDAQALANAINQLLADVFLRKKLGIKASKRIREYFTIEAIKENLIQLYNSCKLL